MRNLKSILIVATLLAFFGTSFAESGSAATETRPFEYRLNAADDLTLTVSALAMTGFGTWLYSRMHTPDKIKDSDHLLPWDRPLAGRYSESADLASDIGSVLAITPLFIGGCAWYGGNSTGTEFATFSLMFTQALAIGNGINLAVRSLEIWPRPYMYAGSKKAEEAKAEAYGSFFSGHATAAFTVATFSDQWFRYVYPNSPYKNIVRASAYSLAGLECALRVAAGKHYFTDVAVGALVGTGISLGILEMHREYNDKFTVWVGPNVAGVTFHI